jgi:hypothetical protein
VRGEGERERGEDTRRESHSVAEVGVGLEDGTCLDPVRGVGQNEI